MMFDLVGMDPRGGDAMIRRQWVGFPRFPRYRPLAKKAPRVLLYSPGAGGVDPLAASWARFTLVRDTGKSLAIQQALYGQYANLARSLGIVPAEWWHGPIRKNIRPYLP